MRDKWGRVELKLFPASCTGHRMTPERFDVLAPLLRAQSYISQCGWSGEPTGVNFDGWRDHYRPGLNLTDMAYQWQRLRHPDREAPWLEVGDVHRLARVIFARSSRYQDAAFPWRRVWEAYHREAIFVGLPEEHQEFSERVGPVPFVPTRDYLELGRIIAGCDLFIGNQSSPRAVAEGLKVPCIVEVYRSLENTHWQRRAAWYGYDGEIEGVLLGSTSDRGLLG